MYFYRSVLDVSVHVAVQFTKHTSLKIVQTGGGTHPSFYSAGTGIFEGVKWPGRDVDHSLHS